MSTKDWTSKEDYSEHYYIDKLTGTVLSTITLLGPQIPSHPNRYPEGIIWKTEIGCWLGLKGAKKGIEDYYAKP